MKEEDFGVIDWREIDELLQILVLKLMEYAVFDPMFQIFDDIEQSVFSVGQQSNVQHEARDDTTKCIAYLVTPSPFRRIMDIHNSLSEHLIVVRRVESEYDINSGIWYKLDFSENIIMKTATFLVSV